MTSSMIKFVGTLPKIAPDYLRCINIYLVRGSEVLAQASVGENGGYTLTLSRQAALAEGQPLTAVVGPGGIEKHLEHLPNLQRVALRAGDLQKAETEFQIPTEGLKISEDIVKLWWTWCRWYCVSGYVIGPEGCPVPGAQVTVYSVGLDLWGFTTTAEVTVTANQNGHFTACFCWCTCPFCCGWPCWPIWWECWPWWWEFDILHVINTLEQVQLQPSRAFTGLQTGAFLSQPAGGDLVRGQGFAAALQGGVEYKPDPARTALIKNKFSNAALRAIFPWSWWCCDDPNIIFKVTQGPNTIVSENPATDTRWCFPDGGTVTLIGNSQTVSYCQAPPPPEGFAWTRVGNIPADASHISGGYAVGGPANGLSPDTSDLAFAGGLDCYGGFGDPSVAYYQVNAGLWKGDPSRGGTAPSTTSTISPTLNNYVFIYHGAILTFSGYIQMGPFNQGGLTNLYATQTARQNGPTPPGLPAFPSYSPGDLILWAYDGLVVSTEASTLIGGATVGAVDLTVNAYTAALAPVTLTPSGTLTLTIDETGVTTQQVTGITAFKSDGSLAPQTGTGECPAYDVGPGGYVQINTTVSDANGHLFEYYIDAEYGHGNAVAVASPGQRGYRINPLVTPAPAGVCALGDPDYTCKGWIGGADVAYFPCAPGGVQCTTSPTNGLPFGVTNEPPDCCYEFRLRIGKRVTNGYTFPALSDSDFQTISLKFSS